MSGPTDSLSQDAHRAVHVTAAMPETGKIMRRLLRDLVVHGRPTGDPSATEDPAALDVAAAAVRN